MNAYTNALALTTALDLLANCGDAELLEKLQHMLDQTAKPRAKQSGPTKTQLQNEALAKQLAQFMWENEVEKMSSKELAEKAGLEGVTSAQKASHLLALCVKAGWVTRFQEKSRTYFGMGNTSPLA